MKKMILYAIGAVVLLALALYGWGLSLATDHEVRVSRNLTAPPGQVFATITNFADHPKWRSGVRSVDYDVTARRVVEKNSMGELPYRILKLDAPRLLVTEIDGGKDLGFGGTWVLTVAPANGGSLVTIVEQGRVYSPFFRVMSKLFFPIDKTAKTYLEDLARTLN